MDGRWKGLIEQDATWGREGAMTAQWRLNDPRSRQSGKQAFIQSKRRRRDWLWPDRVWTFLGPWLRMSLVIPNASLAIRSANVWRGCYPQSVESWTRRAVVRRMCNFCAVLSIPLRPDSGKARFLTEDLGEGCTPITAVCGRPGVAFSFNGAVPKGRNERLW